MFELLYLSAGFKVNNTDTFRHKQTHTHPQTQTQTHTKKKRSFKRKTKINASNLAFKIYVLFLASFYFFWNGTYTYTAYKRAIELVWRMV